jgi:hypothetical protein
MMKFAARLLLAGFYIAHFANYAISAATFATLSAKIGLMRRSKRAIYEAALSKVAHIDTEGF